MPRASSARSCRLLTSTSASTPGPAGLILRASTRSTSASTRPKNLGGSNYKRYCNPKVDSLIKKADANFNPTSRTAQYEAVAKILSDQISIIPLYASPEIFVYKKALKGASNANNPTSEGPTWNIEQWHW